LLLKASHRSRTLIKFDSFAPVAKLVSIRTVLATAAALDLELRQVGITGAYFNGRLTSYERIYMRQPPGYYAPNSTGLVSGLPSLKALYGLNQSGRQWYQRLVKITVDNFGFSRWDIDQAVFFRRKDDQLIILLIHVNGCMVAASSIGFIVGFKQDVARHVEVTDLGELHWLLGIEIRRDREHHAV